MTILDWRVLPQGAYSATIDDVRVNFGALIWLTLSYRVRHEDETYFVSELLALEAPLGSPGYARTAEGKGRIKQILQIHNVPEENIQTFTDIQKVLQGLNVRIEVIHKIVHDLPVAHVRAILGKTAPSPTT
jgi:hypothetical protein